MVVLGTTKVRGNLVLVSAKVRETVGARQRQSTGNHVILVLASANVQGNRIFGARQRQSTENHVHSAVGIARPSTFSRGDVLVLGR